MSHKEKNYLDSCKKMVEVDHDIKEIEQRKRKIQYTLDQVNGQLLVMQKCYKYLEAKNMCLKAAYVRKLKFSQQKVVDKKKKISRQMLSLNKLIMMN